MKWGLDLSVATVTVLLALAVVFIPSSSNYVLSTKTDAVEQLVATKEPALVVEVSKPSPRTLLITGDVMLSRQVGTFMARYGNDYPWRRVVHPIKPDYTLINFEACLSPLKQYSSDATMRFPVAKTATTSLVDASVTHVSLANNHGLDCGAADFSYMKTQFEAAGITAFGHPVVFSTSSVTMLDMGSHTLAVIGVHTLFREPTDSELAEVFAYATSMSDYQLVYVHWGDEYIETAGSTQTRLATAFVRYGADLVIGHHPHVVQNIATIDGVTVVYSLGNFIFDQYFSPAVQRGLVVALTLGEVPTLALHPVTSADAHAQPRYAIDNERAELLSSLALRSDENMRPAILLGTIPLMNLATSAKPAIIAP